MHPLVWDRSAALRDSIWRVGRTHRRGTLWQLSGHRIEETAQHTSGQPQGGGRHETMVGSLLPAEGLELQDCPALRAVLLLPVVMMRGSLLRYHCINNPQRRPSWSGWKIIITQVIGKHNRHLSYRNCRKSRCLQDGYLQQFFVWNNSFPLGCFWSYVLKFWSYSFKNLIL